MINLTPELIIELINLPIIAVAIIINLITAVKSYKSYKKNKVVSTLIFTLTAFFIAFAMVFLVVEKLLLSELMYDEFLGMDVFGTIAVILSGCAIVSIDAFSFSMAFSKRKELLTVLSGILVGLYLGFFIFDPTRYVCSGEISFLWDPLGMGFPITRLVILIVSIILLAIPTLVFFYYALKIKKQSSTRAKRSTFLGIGVLAFASAYIIELFGIDPITTTIMRLFYIVGALFLYYGLFGIKEKS